MNLFIWLIVALLEAGRHTYLIRAEKISPNKFFSLAAHHVFQMLKRSAPEDLPQLIAEVDIDFLLMQAEIKDLTLKR